MRWSASLLWALIRKDRRRSTSDEDDRAGMGTAFGLDASYDSRDHSAAITPPVGPLPDSTPWEHRLTRRSAL